VPEPTVPDEPTAVRWAGLSHAYGPATDVPNMVERLRDPTTVAAGLDELWSSIVHQGSRCSATAATVPLLVDVALDPGVVDRAGVLMLVTSCATGNLGDGFGWQAQRDLQHTEEERAAWRAVAAEHARLRALLDEPDRAVARAALGALVWTGDQNEQVLEALRAGTSSGDDLEQGSAWLAATILGRLPEDAATPSDLPASGLSRFGAAVAGLRLGGEGGTEEQVHELCARFGPLDRTQPLPPSEVVPGEEPERIAAAVLATVPDHLRDVTTGALFDAVSVGPIMGVEPLVALLRLHLGDPVAAGERRAQGLPSQAVAVLRRLVGALASWDANPTIDDRIYELEEQGLPGSAAELAAWLDAGA
jgi:hypothetical protein